MRILLLGQYFPPEITAGATRVHAFAAGLAAGGHEVHVISEIPNHPEGVVAPGYGGRLADRRSMEGFDVTYVWVRATPRKTALARVTNYGSYAATATLAGARGHEPDAIVASSPPLTVGVAGAVLARRHSAPWLLDVRDLWPDAAVALGQIGEGAVLRLTSRLEGWLYRGAAAITATSEPVARTIADRGGAEKVTVIPNGTTEAFLEAGASAPDATLLPPAEGRFRWMYAGNVGLVAGLETAVEAAAELGGEFQLVVVGAGQRREPLMRQAADLPEGTVSFMDPVPPERAAALMRAADALLVPRAPNEMLDDMVLSKLYDCCAVGRPVVVSAAGETARIAGEAGAALCVEPGNPSELAAAIRRVRDDEALRAELVSAARVFAEASSRENGARRLEETLLSLTEAD